MWVIDTVENLCEIEYGTRVVRKREQGTIYPVYGGGGETFRIDRKNRTSRVVIARFGMSERCTRYVDGDFFLNDSGLTLSPKSDELSQDFLNKIIFSLNDSIYSIGRGTAQKNLNMDAFKKLIISYPPLAEQERIVAKLDAAFAGIDRAINLIEVNVTNTNAIYEQKLLNVFELPDSSWIKSSLAELTHQITDGKHGDCNNELNSGYYFLSAKDVRDGTLNYNGAREITIEDFNETHRRTKLESGDILITNSGTIGRMAIAPKHERTSKTTFQKSVAIIKPINDLVDKNYLYFSLKSKVVLLQKISQGAAQKNLLLRDLRALEISYPTTISEQKNLAKKLGIIEKQCSTLSRVLEKKLKQLAMLKSAILQKELQPSEAA